MNEALPPRAADPERFPGIGEYAFLSDCHTGALVAPDGAVEWLCLPRFDSPSVFGAMLDRRAGRFRFGPLGLRVPVSRRYLPGTNVLETTWMCDAGWLVIREALTYALGSDRSDPRAAGAEGILVREATCVHGSVSLEAICEPAPDYATEQAEWLPVGEEGLVADAEPAPEGLPRMRLMGDLPLTLDGASARGERDLVEGESCFCCLTWNEQLEGPLDHGDAARRLDDTMSFWRRWIEGGMFPDHPWRTYLQRSALTLKGLIYAPTGAMVAALTTSLPETPGGGRNWDYRYTWIRDATFTLWSLHVLGFDAEAREFMGFVGALYAGQGPEPQIMFGIGGETALPERTLDHLSGYRDSRPVRVGNAAVNQRQNDVYGALLDSVYLHSKALDGVGQNLWAVVRDQVEGAITVWREPDQGIWEARGEPRHYVSSKLMCWVAVERGARLARGRGEEELAERWAREAELIRSEVLERGVSERGVFRQHYDTDSLDASTLLVPLVRFLPAHDPRVHDTVLAIADELTEHGLVLRYMPEETDDGLGGQAEGTFTICSFWLVSALSEIGAHRRARSLCQRLLGLANPLGLYAEEIDAHSGIQLGNFPQAFTHLALINAVTHVIADQRVDGKRSGHSAVFTEMRPAV